MKFEFIVPHYKRWGKLSGLVDSFLSQDTVEKLLIIDDSCESPPKSIREKIEKFDDRVTFKTNKNNIGYALNFCELIKGSSSEYLIYLADDDQVKHEGLSELCDYIKKSNPDITYTIYKTNDRVSRGTKKEKLISFSDVIRFSTHTPGLVFKREFVINQLDELKKLVRNGEVCAVLYPQVTLILLSIQSAVNDAKFISLPIEIIEGNENLPSNLVDEFGGSYVDNESRLVQYASFLRLIKELDVEDKNTLYDSTNLLYIRHILNSKGISNDSYFKLIWHIVKRIMLSIMRGSK